MAIRLTDLLERIPVEVRDDVRRTLAKNRSIVQEALRTECRLVMRTAEEADENKPGGHVPVEIATGCPTVLKTVTFPDEYEVILLLGRFRNALEQSRDGVKGLLQLREFLARRPSLSQWVGVDEEKLQSTASWATTLLELLDKHDPLKKVLSVDEDILGVYEYHTRKRDRHADYSLGLLAADSRNGHADEKEVNRATIRLYWGVIGLVSEWMGCTVEDLTVVVLTHELAHAYTQLGADIEGRRWPASAFAAAESGLKEGLAQYYTDRVLRKLERRFGGALKVYEAMLPGQPEAYRTHQNWVRDYSPEAIRRAMLEVRRWGERNLADFNRRLEDAMKQLEPEDTNS
jgi:hypothetical protein